MIADKLSNFLHQPIPKDRGPGQGLGSNHLPVH